MPDVWEVAADLGLDAADVINVDAYLVAFSTELDSPHGNFTAGDLLVTNALVIQNQALTYSVQEGGLAYDIGLDAVHFVGAQADIEAFVVEYAGQIIRPEALGTILKGFQIDIWYSTEGTLGPVQTPTFLDGDLLSALSGTIVASNAGLLPLSVPAGIPSRGVDFGLDAVTSDRTGQSGEGAKIHFSTEILFGGEPSFTDGDVLLMGNGVVATNYDLIHCFEPAAKELGLDALSVGVPAEQPCISRITKIGGVDVADIDPVNGMVFPLALDPVSGINAYKPFGGRITVEGNLCPEVTDYRVGYRKEGTSDTWQWMDVQASKNWKVKVDAPFPPWSDCDDSQVWSSDGLGWFDAADYRHLTEPGLGGCNPGLALTVWESGGAYAGDDLYEVFLETQTATDTFSDTVRLVQVDNEVPIVALEKTPGTCDDFFGAQMPLMVTGRMSDTHFYEYQLEISGNGYTGVPYPEVKFYDSAVDNVIGTGTVSWNAFVDLHPVTVYDLDPNPVKCGYTVDLTAWDRTIWSWFHYHANFATRCVGCRHNGDSWTFEFTP
jgi:hypothetical protein